MHVGAEEAVSRLNKVKWANTTAPDRLKILEAIQAKLIEEMEDLGVEEAEQKNMKVGTTDNIYFGDACRYTAVVPVAFAVSAAIDLYRTNLSGKPVEPVRVAKVERNGGVDMIDFSIPDGSQHGDDDDDANEGEQEEDAKDTKEDIEKVNGDRPKEPENPPPEPPTEAPPVPPTEPPPAPPSDPPPTPPSDDPPEPPSDDPPEPPTDEPPQPPADDPPVPPSDPPPPVPGESDDKPEQDSDAKENGGKTSMDATETSVANESQMDEVALETSDDKEVPSNPTPAAAAAKLAPFSDGEKIKIEFDEDDEFAKIDPDKDPEDLIFHDMLVSPRLWNEKGYFNGRQEFLRVQGNPEHRVGPYDRRDPQATAILGASCYSAASEIIKACFLDGHVVVFKPHPYNVEIDRIWAEVLKPMVEVGALSYCLPDQGPQLVQDPGVDQIYLIGSEETAKAIRSVSDKPATFQTGSVNPVIIVPSMKRRWGTKQLRHHALQIVSAGKFNGGHFCGRPQVIITSKGWDQREEFLEELEKAISDRTPPEASYDPKYRKNFEVFVKEYPGGKIIEAANLETDSARVLLVKNASHNSYGLQNEAFCQVLIEVALDLPDHPVAFLPDAVKFCNEKLYGSLCATIVVDDATNKKYAGIVHQAMTDLKYGAVSCNAMALFAWFNPSLYWGEYKENKEDGIARNVGHFGNLMGYENAMKSIIIDTFVGSGHFIKTCRGAFAEKINSLSYYAIEPTMKKVTALKLKGVRAAAARKDW